MSDSMLCLNGLLSPATLSVFLGPAVALSMDGRLAVGVDWPSACRRRASSGLVRPLWAETSDVGKKDETVGAGSVGS
jgi:hypothetical protein